MNSMKRILSHALAASMMLFLAACSDTSDKVIYNGDIPTAAQPDEPTTAAPASPGNIVEVATSAGDFTTLLAAVDASGLSDALSDEGASFTVFAPTDAAFEALPDGMLDALLSEPEELANVLAYHVLEGAVSVNQAGDLAPVAKETLNGNKIAITIVSTKPPITTTMIGSNSPITVPSVASSSRS